MTYGWMRVQIGYLLNNRAMYMCGCCGILGYLFQYFKNNVMYILGMRAWGGIVVKALHY
jgi:hypothetical protein